jgi:hypothetical protein
MTFKFGFAHVTVIKAAFGQSLLAFHCHSRRSEVIGLPVAIAVSAAGGCRRKGVGSVKFRVLLLMLALLLALGLVEGCSALTGKPPTMGAVALTEKVNEQTKAPLAAVTKFPKGSKLMYVSARVENGRQGTKVEARWFYDKEGKGRFGMVDSKAVTFDVTGSRYAAFSLEAATTFPSGTYKVEIWLNDKLAREVPFSVE